VGDCVEVTNLITGKKVLAPYGDLANLQGRVAGGNAILGDHATFPGLSRPASARSSITRRFNGPVGKAARESGFNEIETAINASPDKPGFMEGRYSSQRSLSTSLQAGSSAPSASALAT
jgi:NADPH-dependent 2,4-dienoyl-CoA reductase/sulfur reductase-like enzyme